MVSLYDHSQREIGRRVEYVVDHHVPTQPLGRKELITKMGSAITILYYLFNPKALQQVPSNIDQEFIDKYHQFVRGEPFQTQMVGISEPDID